MPSEVRYHKSTEDIDDVECATVKPLSVTYRRFTVLERALMVAVSVLVVLAIVFGILYATSDNSGMNNGSLAKNDKKCNCTMVDSNPDPRRQANCSLSKNSEKCNCTKEDSNPEPSQQVKSIMDSLDWSVDPCVDFYNFSCNKWLSDHDIPPRLHSLTQFIKLEQDNNAFLQQKLQDKDTIKKYENIEAVLKALSDYSACVSYDNVTESEKYERSLKLISDYGGCNISNSGWSSQNWKLLPSLVKFHRLKVNPLFHVSIRTDIKNSTRHQIVMTQRGSMYIPQIAYLSDDAYWNKLRKTYQELMLDTMTKLANTSKTDPVVTRQIREIFEFEKLLAKISPPSKGYYNITAIKELQNATGNTIDWLGYFQGLFRDTGVEITKETRVNVGYLDYLKNLTQILETTDGVLLANYMIWELVTEMYHIFPKMISKNFVDYYGSRTKPWSERCFKYAKQTFGLPLSLLYSDEKFDEDKLKHIEEIVTGIRTVYIKDIEAISWMDPQTKRMAIKKARSVKQHVGYPDILRDHEKLNKMYAETQIKRNDFFGNWIRKKKIDRKKKLQGLQKPVDKSGWPDQVLSDLVSPNAYYERTGNKIVIPAGILQSPFFDTSRPMPLNYGGIGMMIGHELTHSFDNKGRKYDENGNYFNWWKNSSLMEFNKRTACLAKKYSKYSYYGVQLKVEKSLDENIADNGGIKQAFQAYQTWAKQHDETVHPTFNLTNNQLFFIGSSQIWCSKHRYSQRLALSQAKHSPGMARVIGTLSNYPEFSKAFNCPIGSRMNPKEKCHIW